MLAVEAGTPFAEEEKKMEPGAEEKGAGAGGAGGATDGKESATASSGGRASAMKRAASHPPGTITRAMLLKASPTPAQKGEAPLKYLGRISHLNLERKKLRSVDGLEHCSRLKVLYLYENQLETLLTGENGDDLPLPSLTHLHMQNNALRRMEGMMMLRSLEKLYLDRNAIQRLEGLDECFNLQELHIAHQRLPAGTELTVDDGSLAAISESLEILNVAGNRMSSMEPFAVLRRLTKLNARDNNVADIDAVTPLFGDMRSLRSLDLRGNPVTKVRKYWDKVVIGTPRSLTMFDNKKVDQKQREFLLRFAEQKAKRRAGHGAAEPSFGAAGTGMPAPQREGLRGNMRRGGAAGGGFARGGGRGGRGAAMGGRGGAGGEDRFGGGISFS